MAELPFHLIAAFQMLGLNVNQDLIFENSMSFDSHKDSGLNLKEFSAVLTARSKHGQISSWPLAKFKDDLFVISPSETDLTLISNAVEQSVKNNLIGAAEYIFDKNNKLVEVNYLHTKSALWTIYGSQTNYFEQLVRAKLNLPLGTTNLIGKYVVCGELKNAPGKDEFYPYLHLMAHNPKYKFDKSGNRQFISLIGDDLNFLCAQIKHAQDYYSAKIQE